LEKYLIIWILQVYLIIGGQGLRYFFDPWSPIRAMITRNNDLNFLLNLFSESSLPLIEVDIPRGILSILRQVAVAIPDIIKSYILALSWSAYQTGNLDHLLELFCIQRVPRIQS